MCSLMRGIAFLIVLSSLAASAQAVCPPAPVGVSDTVIQMKATGGIAGIGPAGNLVSTTEGTVVYDGTAKTLKVCDGTQWVEVVAGADTSMSQGWPDAIQCSDGTASKFLSLQHIDPSIALYSPPYDGASGRNYVIFNAAAKTYSSQVGLNGYDCVSAAKSISTLYAEGRAFNFIGGGGVPTGAVMAFALTTCPAGWSEYTPARGRFLRGIDNGAGNDPSGTRTVGNVQADALKSHTHAVYTDNSTLYVVGTGGKRAASEGDALPDESGSAGGAETRPKNVAVLFCRKS